MKKPTFIEFLKTNWKIFLCLWLGLYIIFNVLMSL